MIRSNFEFMSFKFTYHKIHREGNCRVRSWVTRYRGWGMEGTLVALGEQQKKDSAGLWAPWDHSDWKQPYKGEPVPEWMVEAQGSGHSFLPSICDALDNSSPFLNFIFLIHKWKWPWKCNWKFLPTLIDLSKCDGAKWTRQCEKTFQSLKQSLSMW